MVDSDYSKDNSNNLKISTGAVIKNPEMLKFVPDHLRLKRCVKIQLKTYIF